MMKCPNCSKSINIIRYKEKITCKYCEALLVSNNYRKVVGLLAFLWTSLLLYCARELQNLQFSWWQVSVVFFIGLLAYIVSILLFVKYDVAIKQEIKTDNVDE